MTTPDVNEQFAQMGALAANPLHMMYMQAGMDPAMAQYQTQMMMPQMQHHMMAMQAAQMNPAHMLAMQGMGDSTGFNSKGLPIRAGVQPCQFYIKTGDCKFGPACKWDHSEIHDPTAMYAFNPQAAMPGMMPAMAAGIPGNGTHNSLGYPVRPGQQPCSFFSKTGTCSFGASCKWDHPEEYAHLSLNHPQGPPPIPNPANKEPPSGFNSLGYPIRTGQQLCSFFIKTGTCSFGMNCKWDHPEGMGGTQPTYKKAAGPLGPVPGRVAPY